MVYHDDLEAKLADDMSNCKIVLADFRCSVHKRKATLVYDYDNDWTYAHITKCCCSKFAEQVADILLRKQAIDVVDFRDCKYIHP